METNSSGRPEREGVPLEEHGTLSAYCIRRCRCVECREFMAYYNAEAKIRRYNAMRAGEMHPPHGVASTYYNYLCRDDCPEQAGRTCRDAASAQRKASGKRKAARA